MYANLDTSYMNIVIWLAALYTMSIDLAKDYRNTDNQYGRTKHDKPSNKHIGKARRVGGV